ncbi:MAG: hypothetical protein AAF368_03245, partial [Planctomycetota bacterium]
MFSKESSTSFSLSSRQVRFTPQVRVSFITDPTPPVAIASSAHSVRFVFSPEDASAYSIQGVLHVDSLFVGRCSLERDVSLAFSIPSSESFLLGPRSRTLHQGLVYSKRVIESAALLGSLSPGASYHFNSVILLLNLNELFSYSYIFATPTSGFSFYLYRIFRAENLSFSPMSPFSFSENVYSVVRSNESNIKAVQMYSYEFLLYLGIVAGYLYLACFHTGASAGKVNELVPGHASSDKLRPVSTNLLAHLKGSVPPEDYRAIERYLARASNQPKPSRCRAWLTRLVRALARKRQTLLFMVFQILCIDVVHLAVKSLKFMSTLGPSPGLALLCAFYHSVLVFFVAELARIFRRRQTRLGERAATEDSPDLEALLPMLVNLPVLALTVVYVYALLLFS